ncbi:hypothetical protein RFI_04305 [Reticulomyxa filosa]|uniref:Uncharacterized protein n=1 Tax=Reticulomyxa filosa TaxID=46433 RepID=X6P3Y8_RETFI|nr:hypothetical protein RFI_04305 [Reticulomyxa filosa]|eukprot:ETO32809.1 hypothetical protein RFI_04305 [Reticulomyxa filosa]
MYIEHIDRMIDQFAGHIQSVLFKCVNVDESDRCRQSALQCLDSIYVVNDIELHSHDMSLSNEPKQEAKEDVAMAEASQKSAFQPEALDTIISKLFSMLTLGVSKLSHGVRGSIVRLLGILSDRYPSKFSEMHLKKLAALYTKNIDDAVKNPNSMNRQVYPISIFFPQWCLTGLEYFLNEHSSFIPLAPKSRGDGHCMQTVFVLVLLLVKDVYSESRYDVVKGRNVFSKKKKKE